MTTANGAMPTHWPTVAARIDPNLRADLEAACERQGHAKLTGAIREALEQYAARYAPNGNAAARELLDVATPVSHRGDKATRDAWIYNTPRRGSQRARVLRIFATMDTAGAGRTTDEIAATLKHIPHNSVARRVTDLLQGGYITASTNLIVEADHDHDGAIRSVDEREEIVTRRTRAGAQATVWVITDKGREAWESLRK